MSLDHLKLVVGTQWLSPRTQLLSIPCHIGLMFTRRSFSSGMHLESAEPHRTCLMDHIRSDRVPVFDAPFTAWSTHEQCYHFV